MRFDLDTSRGVQPLYMQLANALDAYITDEQLEPGTQLPSEPTLAAENNLSRSTILKAFELLIDRGLISRRRGKGTFVRSRPMERKLPELTSFSEHVDSLGLRPGSILLDYAEFAPGAAGRPGSPFPDDVGIVVLERLRSVGGTPVGLQRLIVPDYVAHRVGLDERAAAQPGFSFYGALRDAGLSLAEGEEALRAINATPEESEHLGVDPGAALIEVDRLSHDPSGQLIEHVRARYLGTHYLYRVTLTNQSNGGSHESDPRTTHRSGGGYTPRAHGVFSSDA
ncbi:GntR family transcriptional regulator [Leucobacter luti]|uniref:GntR family transcriptional regulator n=1 Tax=Leucobacter luti TaxID=340320 RepID=A0A4R6RXW7_9MICO|nr:GntR family transcriptional regulator [Leucobacter luti]MCW2288137.1 GntR family transcriptional regulator [Leucobacter luti]TCK45701.1 GntR family transcriptional regulator [Leucobacter luti]TDP91397.1 GntR family transcriptional regulator [Leucobacter luti]